MSSLVRKIQKNIMKRRGWYRHPVQFYQDPLTGLNVKHPKSGMICNPDGDVISKHWPKMLKKIEVT